MPTPSRFTAETRRDILEALAEGNSRNTAAAMAGIHHSTLQDWIRRGANARRDSRYRQFAEEVAMAEAAARGRALRILNTAMVDQPKWAAWFLERRDPAFSPPAARQQAEAAQPQVIVLTLGDGRPLERALPSSIVEIDDAHSGADSA